MHSRSPCAMRRPVSPRSKRVRRSTGAQAEGCRFDKKPQYRYSGCHGQDASALSIILGLRSGFEEAQYAVHGRARWRRVAPAAARLELQQLERNSSDERPTDHPPAPP